jgi:hypothetical protein
MFVSALYEDRVRIFVVSVNEVRGVYLRLGNRRRSKLAGQHQTQSAH